MKKTLLTFFVALTAFTAVEAQSVESAAGKYCGELYVSLGAPVDENAAELPNQSVDLSASETAGAVDFALYNFGFLGLPLGNIELPGVGFALDGTDGTFSENPARPFSFLGGQIEATALLNHTTSYVKGDSLVANIDVVWTNGGDLPIYVLFKGVKLEPADIQPLAGLYKGTFTISNEAGTQTLSTQNDVKLTLSATGTNSAALAMSEVTMQESDKVSFTFNPVFRNNASGMAELVPAEASYMFYSGDKQVTANIDMGACSLSADGMTLKFTATIDDVIYSCTYEAEKDLNAGIHAVATSGTGAAIYSLGGMRMGGKNLPKGVYVINGKKTIIK